MRIRQGSALLAVLWLSAALGAIAFSVATSVRGEMERTATGEEDVRAYYLAQGAIQRAMLYVEWAHVPPPEGVEPYFQPGQPQLVFDFPSGQAVVEVIPEAGKIDINRADAPTLERLLLALGVTPAAAGNLAGAIVDWRSPAPDNQPSAFDQTYLAMQPSFQGSHASFQEIEELLRIPGITPDLFYGTWVRQPDADSNGAKGRLVPIGGLRDCISLYGSLNRFEVNTVQPAVLAAAGAPPEEIQALVNRRRVAPFRNAQEVADFVGEDQQLLGHIGIDTHTMFTFRATARIRRPDGSLSDLRRSVAALVKFLPPNFGAPFHILRWYDRG